MTDRSVQVLKEFCERIGKIETSPPQTTGKVCVGFLLHLGPE